MSSAREIYRAEQLPVFQNRMFDSAQAARECSRGDVVLVQDLNTGLIFNQAFDPELMRYDANYQNEQGHSRAFRSHLEHVGRLVLTHFRDQTLIEVGCGKGYFLEQLQDLGCQVIGLDPTYEGDNPAVVRDYFMPSTGLRADGLILRHVLEHVRDPVGFLTQLRDANGGGKIYIEVPCVEWIAKHRAWFDIFYEHVNYFRLSDLENIFCKTYAAGRVFGDQYLYIVADLASLRTPSTSTATLFDFPSDFLSSVTESVAALASKTGRTSSNQTAIWGGASKGVIFALFMQRAGFDVDMVVDINPAKQGRFLAATGHRVHSPEEAMRCLAPGADVFVMNRNYLDEIQELTARRFNYISLDHEQF